MFSRRPPDPPEYYLELIRRVGRLEAENENLTLQWKGYRDEIKRLVNRLEKRDERAAEKAREVDLGGDPSPVPVLDQVSARILARRQRRGLQGTLDLPSQG